jgi:hypothetical protein
VVGDKVFENVIRSVASEKKRLLLSHRAQAPISSPSEPIGAAFFVATRAVVAEPWQFVRRRRGASDQDGT